MSLEFPARSSGIEPIPFVPPATVKIYQKKVFVGCPWGKSTNPITSFCVSNLLDKRRTVSALNFDDGYVSHSRDTLVDYFLKTDLEWYLQIDDDMLIPFGDAALFKTFSGWENYPEPFASFNAIDRLLSHNKPLVGACYFGRHSKGVPVFGEGNNPAVAAEVRKGPVDECRPTRWVGTGALLCHRSVFLAIEKKYPNLARGADKRCGRWFTTSEADSMDAIRRTREMLSVGAMDGEKAVKALSMLIEAESYARANSGLGQGEDVTLSKRAFASGIQPHVDLGLICGHLGTCCYGPYNTRTK